MLNHQSKEKNMQKATEKKSGKNCGKMPVFKCWCGAKILVVPDLREMDKAIKHHAVEHKKATGQSLPEEFLIRGILKAIAES